MLHDVLEFVRHLDTHLETMATEHGPWMYAIFFAIIFVETGLIVMPFLPGDSLLFVAGAIAARGVLNPWILVVLLPVAAIIGDNVNYGVGTLLRSRVRTGKRIPLVKPKHIDRTQAFFTRYGPKAVMLARFVPIVRTMTPFCAGVGAMPYRKFLAYSLAGGFVWVGICVGAGHLFGNIPAVRKNFEFMVLGVIFVSLIPIGVEAFLHHRATKKAAAMPSKDT